MTDYEHIKQYTIASIACSLIVLLVFLALSCNDLKPAVAENVPYPLNLGQIKLSEGGLSDFMPINEAQVNIMADAIFWAENSKRYPYGVKSIDTGGNHDYARQITVNSIRNGVARYEGRSADDGRTFLQHFGARWCPADAHSLNRNFISNVEFYIRNPKPVRVQ